MNSPRFEDLVALMARLRAPDGCPWDREQTPRSLRTYVVEEAYEVVEAIEDDDASRLRDELGDLLLQVLFLAQIASEQGRFGINDVIYELHTKLVRRHPHVFGQVEADTPAQVVKNWEALKAGERGHVPDEPGGLLESVPRHQPALVQAYQLTRRAAQVGFDWPHLDDLLGKLDEEIAELRQALGSGAPPERLEDEVGDLLFVGVNLARHLNVDPEVALRGTNRKFRERFRAIEAELKRRGRRWPETSLAELDTLWEQSKQPGPSR